MKTKACKTCERELPRDSFKDASYDCKDGKLDHCLGCLNIWSATKRYNEKLKGQTKWCKRCKTELPLSRFARLNTWYQYKIAPDCLECQHKAVRKSKAEWSERQLHPLHRKMEIFYLRASQICDVSREEFKRVVKNNIKTCKICGEKETAVDGRGNVKRLCVDHCHETNTFRGLLCQRCNTGLGMFKDDIDTMTEAISYLDSHMMSIGR